MQGLDITAIRTQAMQAGERVIASDNLDIIIVGVLLASVQWDNRFLWFVPLLFLVIRPVAVAMGLLGTDAKPQQRRLMAWFGIRGIGSLYYLMYAINHGIERDLAQQLLSVTLVVMVCSVVVHGVSVTPLMQHYEAQKKGHEGSKT